MLEVHILGIPAARDIHIQEVFVAIATNIVYSPNVSTKEK